MNTQPWGDGRFGKALVLANELHRTQYRKGSGVPYVSHLLGVASIVLEYGGTEDEAMGALLHDALEDQGTPEVEAQIRALGEDVLAIVHGCSDYVADGSGKQKPPWRERKEAYVAHARTASTSVKLVSCADKLYNVRSMLADLRRTSAAELWSRFRATPADTVWYLRSVADAFRADQSGHAGLRQLVEELDREVVALEAQAAQAA